MPVSDECSRWVEAEFVRTVLPTLLEFIAIPNKSPAFDPEWRQAGHMERAVSLLADWARAALPDGATLEVVRLEERTPVIFIDIPATGGVAGDAVLLYGHLDKQPEMTGWRAGLGPWQPVLEGDQLYGRGGADDGYAIFASLLALGALRRDKLPHARAVVLIEACEESGSTDLPAYIAHLAPRIGELSLVVCLDSGCANYEQLWSTTSLRGIVVGTLEVSLLREGVHSGDGSGVVASSFRVARRLLDRLEDADTGLIQLDALRVPIPPERAEQARRAAAALGDAIWQKFPLQPGVEPVLADNAELILNRTWRPALAVTGAEGLPALANAGNVLRPVTRLKLSLRVPPRLDAERAALLVKTVLEQDPPYGAQVRFESGGASNGWDAPELSPWLAAALEAASVRHFGKPAMYLGEGGSIPFMAMLGEKFPRAQFCVTGVLGRARTRMGQTSFCICRPRAS
jgi:acetylornithine deacetylase/succinyl-diaminopimelate desuccinylase-like protein